MLIVTTLADIEKYGEEMYRLALDKSCSSYPTYADGIKNKWDFYAAAKRLVQNATSELLLYVRNEKVEGQIGYFWLTEDKYLELEFCITRGMAHGALSELSERIGSRFPDYNVYFGFPSDNSDAVNYLKDNGFEIIEESYNYSFFFENYSETSDDSHVKKILRDNFNDFRSVYKPGDKTYWTPDRILAQLEKWTAFTYSEQVPLGAIFVHNGVHSEILGLEIATDTNCHEICSALIRAVLNSCKRSNVKFLTFLCDDAVRKVAEDCGFTFVSKYLCLYKNIRPI